MSISSSFILSGSVLRSCYEVFCFGSQCLRTCCFFILSFANQLRVLLLLWLIVQRLHRTVHCLNRSNHCRYLYTLFLSTPFSSNTISILYFWSCFFGIIRFQNFVAKLLIRISLLRHALSLPIGNKTNSLRSILVVTQLRAYKELNKYSSRVWHKLLVVKIKEQVSKSIPSMIRLCHWVNGFHCIKSFWHKNYSKNRTLFWDCDLYGPPVTH